MIWTNHLLWLVYLSLLAVLLPHTAWAFARFEPQGIGWLSIRWGIATAWAAAFAFEAAIAVLTYKLARHIERTPRYTAGWIWLRRTRFRYFNAYALGLAVVVAVSALANLAHSVQFGGDMVIFARYSVPFALYSVAFGGVLPFVSLLFARVLSNVVEGEGEPDPALDKAKAAAAELRRQLSQTEAGLEAAERRAIEAETRYDAMGDLFIRLFSEEKRDRILAARSAWPQLPGAAIAIIADASPSYVSDVLKTEEVS